MRTNRIAISLIALTATLAGAGLAQAKGQREPFANARERAEATQDAQATATTSSGAMPQTEAHSAEGHHGMMMGGMGQGQMGDMMAMMEHCQAMMKDMRGSDSGGTPSPDASSGR
ncbi:hypothetical protein [Indioceanicola profundi]|uniref:hypothetical protein n=1 Tax=Indioceanicola profundi TaxID=2220096 RepID=UPI000E6A9A4A|nr:hypothetical protein [Indioceanicola profundi]